MASLAAQPFASRLSEVYRRHLDSHDEVESAKQQLRLLKSMIDDDTHAYNHEVSMPSRLSACDTDTYFCILHASDTKVVIGFCLVDWPPLVAMASDMGLREHVTVGSRDPAIPCSASDVVDVIRAALREGKNLHWAGGAYVPQCSMLG